MTSTTPHTNPAVRHDFIVIFDATMSNPNGDPDGDNRPRQDPLTSRGIVTDVCTKRKVRDLIDERYGDEDGYALFVARERYLNDVKRAAVAHIIAADDAAIAAAGDKKARTALEKELKALRPLKIRDAMVDAFIDVRLFGAVLTTGDEKGRVHRGPVQIGNALSVAPVDIIDQTIARVVRTDEKETVSDDGHARGDVSHGTFGTRAVVRHGVYVQTGQYSPQRANYRRADGERALTVTEQDLDVLFEALTDQFVEDASAARPNMAVREVIIFTHDSGRGAMHAHRLHERVNVTLHTDISESWEDYTLDIDEDGLAERGVTVTRIQP